MIKIEEVEVAGLRPAIRGMRNPMNSWELSDSGYCENFNVQFDNTVESTTYAIGPNDHKLMTTLRNAGTDHRKYMRMIVVYLDITAPLYWWKEFDTYKVGTVANSCSTMHKIHAKEFTLEDFSCEHLLAHDSELEDYLDECSGSYVYLSTANPGHAMNIIIGTLNYYRMKFLQCQEALKSNITYGLDPEKGRERIKEKQKNYWWQMIQLLPSSYNQKRTIMLNYEVLANMYRSRKAHKLDEWREFCKWIESLPYSELITGKREPKEYDTESYPDAARLVGKIDKKLDELKNKEESNE